MQKAVVVEGSRWKPNTKQQLSTQRSAEDSRKMAPPDRHGDYDLPDLLERFSSTLRKLLYRKPGPCVHNAHEQYIYKLKEIDTEENHYNVFHYNAISYNHNQAKKYSRASMARTLMALLPRLFRTRS